MENHTEQSRQERTQKQVLVGCGSGFDIIYKCFTISIPIKIFIEAMTYWIAVDTCMSLSAKLSIYKFEDS